MFFCSGFPLPVPACAGMNKWEDALFHLLEPYFTCCMVKGDAFISVSGKTWCVAEKGEVWLYICDMGRGSESIAGVTWCPSRAVGGACVEFGGSLWSNPGSRKFSSETSCTGQCCGIWAVCSLFQLCHSLTIADLLSTTKGPFTLNYGCIKQWRAFNWAAIQKAGASS